MGGRFWRTDHAHRHDGRGLDDCFASVRRIAVAPRRLGPGRSEVSRGLALFRGSQHHVAGSSGEIRTLEQRLETVLAIRNASTSFLTEVASDFSVAISPELNEGWTLAWHQGRPKFHRWS